MKFTMAIRTKRGVARKRYARKYISKRKAVRRARKSNFKKAVVSVIKSQAEDKAAFFTTGNSLVNFDSQITGVADMLQLVPNISVGSDNNQRVGDTVTAKSLTVSGYMKFLPSNLSANTKAPSVIARVMVLSTKYRQNFNDVTGSTSPLQNLLKKGGTTSSFGGNLSDIYAPVNTSLFTVHHDRKFYLNQSYMAPVGVSAPSATVASDIKNTVKFFKFAVRCRNKKLRYDTGVGSDVQPTNWAPFMVIGYAYLDGSSPDTVGTNMGINYSTNFYYEDM